MKKFASVLALAAGLTFVNPASAVSIDIGSLDGAAIVFNGISDSFTFLNVGGSSFSVLLVDGDPFAPEVGLEGRIDGVFAISDVSPIIAGVQTATVTSSAGAKLVINDGANTFSGFINWIELRTEATGGNLNIAGAVNLTGISYSGSSSALLALAGESQTASATLAFGFRPQMSISDLIDGVGTKATSFEGTLANVPDAGATVGLLGGAFLALGALRRSFRK
jgi:hypothetical protein